VSALAILHQSKSITDETGVLYEQITGVKCRTYPNSAGLDQ
jgi:hypothetical protein